MTANAVNTATSNAPTADGTTVTDGDQRRDDGAILVFVLVVVIMISLISIPMLGYITSVLRFNNVQAERSQAVELANGGVWVALSNERDLYDRCPDNSGDPAKDLPTSLDGVVAKCYLLDDAPLRPATEVPFHVSTVAADTQVPAVIAAVDGVEAYTNPSTFADPSAWLKDRTATPTLGSVWIPQLPTQASSDGDIRMTTMPPKSFDSAYDTCRVFFPGTYNNQIVISEPAYFTSGVYSFTQPIVLRDGADVVVGNGTASGCTNDFEAIGNAVRVPDQLNMSGLGGTFVLGGSARITVDDAGGDDIRFVINQRYVSSQEKSVAASSDVAIVSVNGTHAPFLDGEALGQALYIPGVTDVPASTVDTDGDPAAALSGYVPSSLTAKPSVPDAPSGVTADDFRIGSDGRVTVNWSIPSGNGAPVIFYVATDSVTGQTCRTLRPLRAGAEVQPTCTLRNMPDGVSARITVTATNQHGTSRPSTVVTAPAVVLSGGTRSPEVANPTPAPSSPSIKAYSDGALVEWTAPTPVAGAPVGFSEVRAVDTASGDVVTCRAAWNEARCALLASDGLSVGSTYDVTVRSLLVDGDFDRVYTVRAPRVTVNATYAFTSASGSVPQPSATTATGVRVPTAILDFSTSTGTDLEVRIDGYVAVPQGRVQLDAAAPDRVSISMTGGVLAGSIELDPTKAPAELDVRFDNPVAQKRVRIVSDVVARSIRADAVVQINRSGSLAINSWVVGAANDTTTPAPDSGGGDGGLDGEDDSGVPYVDAYAGGGASGVDYDTGFPGDRSGASTPHTCTDTSRWAVSYWNNVDLAGPAELERCEDAVNADWGTGAGPTGASDSFSARFTKTIDFANSNEYDFTLGADDGIRMWIDGELVHDNWATGGFVEDRIRLDIDAGPHVVEIEYWENTNVAEVSMDYVETLTCSGATPWLGTFYDGRVLAGASRIERCDAAIDFDWFQGAGPTGASDNFSARWVRTLDVAETGDYQMLIGADDGVRVFVDGISVYDRWVDKGYSEEALVLQLAAGEREIVVEYYENGGDAKVVVDIEAVYVPTCADLGQWEGSYFDNNALSGVPVLTRCDPVIDFDWGTGAGPTGAADNFSVSWTKTVDIDATGDYDFRVIADHGVRVRVDGTQVFSRWGRQDAVNEANITQNLAAGQREITVEYRELTGTARVLLDFAPVVVEAPTCASAGQWQGDYWSNNSLTGTPNLQRCDAAIDFNWGDAAGPTGTKDNFSARWTKTIRVATAGNYKVTIGADDGIRMFVDGVNVYPNFWKDKSYSTQTVTIPFAAGERKIVVEYYEKTGGARAFVDLSKVPVGAAPAALGSSANPYACLAQVTSGEDGRRWFNFGRGAFQASVDSDEGGSWVMVLQYEHLGGTNPALSIVAPGSNWPEASTGGLGTDGSGTAAWGHTGQAAAASIPDRPVDLELRWYAESSSNKRTIHFRSPVLGQFQTNTASGFVPGGIAKNFTPLGEHDAQIPAQADNGFTNRGDEALTNFPFYRSGTNHWGVRGSGNRWEADDYPNDQRNSTLHQTWVRSTSSSTACP